jgi:hypothetical protein
VPVEMPTALHVVHERKPTIEYRSVSVTDVTDSRRCGRLLPDPFLGPLGFNFSQHSPTRPSVESIGYKDCRESILLSDRD